MRLVNLDEYKDIILQILIKTDKICRENGLAYSISYGTLLGAVRHKGYIPWDDDIDIVMPMKDFYKLVSIVNAGDYGIKIWWCENNENFCFPFGKICATNTVIKEGNLKEIEGYGAYVDLFPLVKIPNKKRPRRWNLMNRMCSYSYLLNYTKSSSRIKTMIRASEFYVSRFINGNKCAKRIVNSSKRINEKVERYDLEYCYENVWESRSKFPKDMFSNQSEVEFEEHTFLGPNNPDKILQMQYGDYMKLPPVEQRVSHHYLQCWVKDQE